MKGREQHSLPPPSSVASERRRPPPSEEEEEGKGGRGKPLIQFSQVRAFRRRPRLLSVFLGGECTTYLRAQTIPGQFVYSVACIFEAWCPSVCNLQCCHHARVHRNVPVSLRVVVSLKQFKTDSKELLRGKSVFKSCLDFSLSFFLSPPVNVSIVVIRRNERSPQSHRYFPLPGIKITPRGLKQQHLFRRHSLSPLA